MSYNVIVEKSFDFAVRIVNLRKYLTREHKEFVLSKQLLRSGTSIGANVSEAQRGQSKADFTAKMSIVFPRGLIPSRRLCRRDLSVLEI